RGGAITVYCYPSAVDGKKLRSCDANAPERAFRIDIADTGSGIKPEYLKSIFEEYTSYAGPLDRSSGGLGLAICKMIANMHGGVIWAESEGPGCTFSFVIPVPGDASRSHPIHLPSPLVQASGRYTSHR